MTGVAIYIEGGGDGRDGKAELRQGFDALLARQKTAARARNAHWKLVLCGGRNATFDAFRHASETARGEVVVLLVDAEDPVASATPAGRVEHLARRDGWDLRDAAAERVHLMTQCMETWIVADGETLAAFYGQQFHAGSLPGRKVLDDEPKPSVYAALAAATKNTQKGSYGKIKHASALLKQIRPEVVAARCASFRQFRDWLDAAIADD